MELQSLDQICDLVVSQSLLRFCPSLPSSDGLDGILWGSQSPDLFMS